MPNFNPKHILLATAAAVLAASGIAAAAPPPGAHDAPTRRIPLVELQRSSTQLDLGKKAFSPGDRQTITSDVLTPAGKKIGRLDDDCAITQAGKRPEAVCTFVISLPDGELTGGFAQSLAGSDSGKRQAITGGTGAFAGARGQIVAGAEGKRTRFTVVLR
jgi:hypothetical protein